MSMREKILFGMTGVAISVALYFRNQSESRRKECEEQRTRKNELAMDLSGLRNQNMESEESKNYGHNFKPRPSDVFVVTYPKCGTTWMTQICHMLRGGNMDFNEITEVCPWDVMALTCGQDLDADHVAEPRVFKSHCEQDKIAKGGKYIYVARNPEDAFVSFFHFLPGYTGLEPDDITMKQFADAIFAKTASHNGTIWDHYMGWYAVKDDPKVLWGFFEDLKTDFKAQIERVAAFMEIPADLRQKRVAQAVEKASFRFMSSLEHKGKFDENFTFNKVKGAMGLPEEATVGVSKVRQGKTGTRSTIPPEIYQRLVDQWRTKIAAKTQCQDYDAFRQSFRA